MIDLDAETKVPCPACDACLTCGGTRKITCYRCPQPHTMDCPADTTCGLCQGTQLVTSERRQTWLRLNPPPPEAA